MELDSEVSSKWLRYNQNYAQDDQQNKEIIAQNGGSSEQNVRRSSRTKTKSVILTSYERFLDQVIDAEGDLLEEMMMDESEPIDLSQAMNCSNLLALCKKSL